MIFEDGHYILRSGRRLYSHCGILGLGPDVTEGASEGYDGWFEESDEQPLTQAERQEISREMIQRWVRWRDLT